MRRAHRSGSLCTYWNKSTNAQSINHTTLAGPARNFGWPSVPALYEFRVIFIRPTIVEKCSHQSNSSSDGPECRTLYIYIDHTYYTYYMNTIYVLYVTQTNDSIYRIIYAWIPFSPLTFHSNVCISPSEINSHADVGDDERANSVPPTIGHISLRNLCSLSPPTAECRVPIVCLHRHRQCVYGYWLDAFLTEKFRIGVWVSANIILHTNDNRSPERKLQTWCGLGSGYQFLYRMHFDRWRRSNTLNSACSRWWPFFRTQSHSIEPWN